MLLATTVMLLVFRSPSAILYVMWIIRAKMFINEKPPFRLRKFHSIANLCATLNAATTFIIFVIYGTKFRSEFNRLYCGILTKFKKSTIRQDQPPQQQQPMKQLIPNNDQNENGENTHNMKMNLPLTDTSNGHLYVESLKDNGSAATSMTTASNSSKKPLISQQQNRYSYDEEYDFMMKHNNDTRTNFRQHQVSIREDECTDNPNDAKSVSLTGSYFDWFKNLIGFRP